MKIDKVVDGGWFLTGGTHHRVLVEMNDHLVVIEGPQDDARATAVIAEVKKTVPNKPIKPPPHRKVWRRGPQAALPNAL